MKQRSSLIHASHKLLLVALLLVAFCVPFVLAGSHNSDISHNTLVAGSGVLGSSQAQPTQVNNARQTHLGATVTSAAGQSLTGLSAK